MKTLYGKEIKFMLQGVCVGGGQGCPARYSYGFYDEDYKVLTS